LLHSTNQSCTVKPQHTHTHTHTHKMVVSSPYDASPEETEENIEGQ